jgi:hypothetical protein
MLQHHQLFHFPVFFTHDLPVTDCYDVFLHTTCLWLTVMMSFYTRLTCDWLLWCLFTHDLPVTDCYDVFLHMTYLWLTVMMSFFIIDIFFSKIFEGPLHLKNVIVIIEVHQNFMWPWYVWYNLYCHCHDNHRFKFGKLMYWSIWSIVDDCCWIYIVYI